MAYLQLLQSQTTIFDITQFDPSFPAELYSIPSILSSTILFLIRADTLISTNIPWLNVIWKSLLRLILKKPVDALSEEARQCIANGFARRFQNSRLILTKERESKSKSESGHESENGNDNQHGFELVKFFLTLFTAFARQYQPIFLRSHADSSYSSSLHELCFLLNEV